jgi:3-hydroxyacyl-CoA dehydrogenase
VGASEADIERLLFPVAQDAVQLLATSPVGTSADDIDVAYTQGSGFPRYLGGPLWWASRLGLERLRVGLQKQGVAVVPVLADATTLADVQKLAAPKL